MADKTKDDVALHEGRRGVPDQRPIAGTSDPNYVADPRTAEARRQADEKMRKDNEEAQQKAREKSREFSDKMFEAQQQRLADEQKQVKEQRELREKHQDDRQKEIERRAALSPAERLEEDEKRASRTPEEIAKENEEKGIVGFVSPEQMDQINPLAGTPSYPLFNETAHPTEMVLTEANGQRSRAYAYLADPVTIKVGQPLKQTVAPTSTTPGTFVPAAVGADCTAIALYGGTSNPSNGLRIAVLVRDCEVNGYQISWGAITVPEQAIGLTTLAAQGIIVRY
jgi:Bacteriophage lambda head decoration protein D